MAPYFIDYVSRVSEGGKGVPPVDQVQDEPATITTLDLDLQRIAAQATKRQLDRLDEIYGPRGLTPQVALIALDPKTGNVLAMIGGRDYASHTLIGPDAPPPRDQPGQSSNHSFSRCVRGPSH